MTVQSSNAASVWPDGNEYDVGSSTSAAVAGGLGRSVTRLAIAPSAVPDATIERHQKRLTVSQRHTSTATATRTMRGDHERARAPRRRREQRRERRSAPRLDDRGELQRRTRRSRARARGPRRVRGSRRCRRPRRRDRRAAASRSTGPSGRFGEATSAPRIHEPAATCFLRDSTPGIQAEPPASEMPSARSTTRVLPTARISLPSRTMSVTISTTAS